MGQCICSCYWAYPSSPTSHSSVCPPLKIHQTLATPMDCVFRLLDIGIHTFELWAMGARASFTTCSSLPQQSSPMTSTLNEYYLKQYSAKGPTMSYGTIYMQLLLSLLLLAHQPLLREPTPKDTPNSRNTDGLRLPASRYWDTYLRAVGHGGKSLLHDLFKPTSAVIADDFDIERILPQAVLSKGSHYVIRDNLYAVVAFFPHV